MSRSGNCYDNAVAESFFHTLKVELVDRNRYKLRISAAVSLVLGIGRKVSTIQNECILLSGILVQTNLKNSKLSVAT